jgi:hypothetical protein
MKFDISSASVELEWDLFDRIWSDTRCRCKVQDMKFQIFLNTHEIFVNLGFKKV